MSDAPVMSSDASDVLQELVNIGVGRAAASLSDLCQREVTITVPTVELIAANTPRDLLESPDQLALRISQQFSGELGGHALLVLEKNGAARLAELLLGVPGDDDAFDENAQGALLELGNIIIGGALGCIANELDVPVSYEIPFLQLNGVNGMVDLISDLVDDPEDTVLLMRASLSIRSEELNGYLMLLFRQNQIAALIERLERLSAGIT